MITRKRQSSVTQTIANIDLVVVPMTAFDNQKNRLGMGQGYYDRVLMHMPQAAKVALAFDCQQVDQVPMSTWDVVMDTVVTPSRVIL